MSIEVAAHAGFCMGVRRAVEAAEQVVATGQEACTWGEIIHNPRTVAELAAKGIAPIASADEACGRKVLIRSHGVSPDVLNELQNAGSEVVDLTCPFVGKVHRIVAEGSADGTPVIIVGEKEHPEVLGTSGWVQSQTFVVATAEEAEALPPMQRAIVVAQTTFPHRRYQAILDALQSRIPDLMPHATICLATEVRQKEAVELAKRSSAMIVVGGRKSANTQKLFALCKEQCPRTILVERAEEIPADFADPRSDSIGITAGASTPTDSLEEVLASMTDNEQLVSTNEEIKNDNPMAAMLAETVVKIHKGQTVTGTVDQVTDDELIVNIHYKTDGVLKRSDMSQTDAKVGDEIEVEVVQVNDKEGIVVLSQRNIVNRKAWEALMAKYNAGEYLDGVGKEAVKGGLIADVDGIRAFVPASQLAPRYVEKISEFVGKEMKLKVIEIDEKKKRVVASRKQAVLEERAAKKNEAWEHLEEGVIIHGIVRRLTDFGAFVDIGGVDGLIHITDLSWGHVKHPSEVVAPNQEVDVKILSLDRERDRIQLGYKQLQPRPWDNAAEKYPEGSIVEGKVVRITDFGAFVELQPGLDGLVHISQCALKRVAKVEDAVQVGETVRVKVLSVDTERKRISLSIRQVLEEEAFNTDMDDMDAEVETVASTDDLPVEAQPEA